MMTMEQVFRVELSYACFGLIVRDTTVVRAPPIAKWAVHKDIDTVLSFYQSKGATITHLADRPVG